MHAFFEVRSSYEFVLDHYRAVLRSSPWSRTERLASLAIVHQFEAIVPALESDLDAHHGEALRLFGRSRSALLTNDGPRIRAAIAADCWAWYTASHVLGWFGGDRLRRLPRRTARLCHVAANLVLASWSAVEGTCDAGGMRDLVRCSRILVDSLARSRVRQFCGR